MPGFLDVLRETASNITATVGETVSLAGQVGQQRAREIVSDFLDAPEPSPQLLFTSGGALIPGRPLNDPTGRLNAVQSIAGQSQLNFADRNAAGTNATGGSSPGTFGLSAGLFGGGSGSTLLIGGGLALAATLFLILRR